VSDFDIIVIGAGPGGYVAAIRASQLGLKTAIIERESVGGVCLNWGCIPSKALLRNAEVLNLIHSADKYGITFDNLSYDFGVAIDRSREVVNKLTSGVEYLLKKNNVEHISGSAVFETSNSLTITTESGEARSITGDNILIATGARQREIPSMPIDHSIVMNSRDALDSKTIPNRVLIVGGGATGAEFAHIYNSYGSNVTIVELEDRIVPNEDKEISQVLTKSFTDNGINLFSSSSVDSIETNADFAIVNIDKNGEKSKIECDRVLVAVGVQANTDNLGLEDIGLETDRGFIPVDGNMNTSIPNIFAIGDVTGKMLLAHVASAQGVTAIEHIAGLNPPELDYSIMPRAIYCEPQIASFGLTEEQAKDQGIDINIGKFPFSASGKAIALDKTDGIVKLVVDQEIGEIIGAHMIGSEVTELLAELSMTKMLEGTTTELGWLVHPHPTISEIIKEAALDTTGEAIHI
jgi:dihydrolipoamide dehydrogenase